MGANSRMRSSSVKACQNESEVPPTREYKSRSCSKNSRTQFAVFRRSCLIKTQLPFALLRKSSVSLVKKREWKGIEPSWRLLRRHNGFEARDGHQIRIHSRNRLPLLPPGRIRLLAQLTYAVLVGIERQQKSRLASPAEKLHARHLASGTTHNRSSIRLESHSNTEPISHVKILRSRR